MASYGDPKAAMREPKPKPLRIAKGSTCFNIHCTTCGLLLVPRVWLHPQAFPVCVHCKPKKGHAPFTYIQTYDYTKLPEIFVTEHE